MEYKEKINVYIENIASKKQTFWRPICEVIENSYFEETKLFPTIFFNQCGNNPNEPQKIPNEIKSYLKRMDMEKGFNAQVVMIRQKESDDKMEKEKT